MCPSGYTLYTLLYWTIYAVASTVGSRILPDQFLPVSHDSTGNGAEAIEGGEVEPTSSRSHRSPFAVQQAPPERYGRTPFALPRSDAASWRLSSLPPARLFHAAPSPLLYRNSAWPSSTGSRSPCRHGATPHL